MFDVDRWNVEDVAVEGFASIEKAVVQLGAVNVLIGANGASTAPSKRLIRVFADLGMTYNKTLHGPAALRDFGLDRVREQCPHLDAWLTMLAERSL